MQDDDIAFAAGLAVHFSKAKSSPRFDVTMCYGERAEGREVTTSTTEPCARLTSATLAACSSDDRDFMSLLVAIAINEPPSLAGKDVRKPKGAPPGMVTVATERVVSGVPALVADAVRGSGDDGAGEGGA